MKTRTNTNASTVEKELQRSNNLLFESFRLMIRVKRTREPAQIVGLRWTMLLACCIFTGVKLFYGMHRETGMLTVQLGGYYFGTVDGGRGTLERYARKIQGRVFGSEPPAYSTYHVTKAMHSLQLSTTASRHNIRFLAPFRTYLQLVSVIARRFSCTL